VLTSGRVTREDRAQAWNELQGAAKEKKTRPFYRAANKHGLMYAGKPCSSSSFSVKLQSFFLDFYFVIHSPQFAYSEDGFAGRIIVQ